MPNTISAISSNLMRKGKAIPFSPSRPTITAKTPFILSLSSSAAITPNARNQMHFSADNQLFALFGTPEFLGKTPPEFPSKVPDYQPTPVPPEINPKSPDIEIDPIPPDITTVPEPPAPLGSRPNFPTPDYPVPPSPMPHTPPDNPLPPPGTPLPSPPDKLPPDPPPDIIPPPSTPSNIDPPPTCPPEIQRPGGPFGPFVI